MQMSRDRFTSLPNELIDHILRVIDPPDIESFALCNRTIYHLSTEAIRRHKDLKTSYDTICLGFPAKLPVIYRGNDFGLQAVSYRDGNPGLQNDHPLVFLEQLLSKSWLAHYPCHLQLPIDIRDDELDDEDSSGEDESPGEEDEDWEDEDVGGGDEDIREEVENIGEADEDIGRGNPVLMRILHERTTELAALAREQHAILPDPAWRPVWHETSFRRSLKDRVYAFAVLLAMLPNLSCITVSNVMNTAEPIKAAVNAIAVVNHTPTSPFYMKALSKLKEVRFIGLDRDEPEDFTSLTAFACLPSLRVLHGRNVHGDVEFHPLKCIAKESNVEEVYLIRSDIPTKDFWWFLKEVKALKRFTYHHERGAGGLQNYDAGGIVTVLQKFASTTLEQLDLTANQWRLAEQRLIELTTAIEYIGDLKGFSTLRTLRVDGTAFEQTKAQIELEPCEEKVKQGNDVGNTDHWDSEEDSASSTHSSLMVVETTPLVDILPASIQSLKIKGGDIKAGPWALFEGLAEAKEEGRFPDLQQIEYFTPIEWAEFVRERVEEEGVDELVRVWVVSNHGEYDDYWTHG